MTKKKRLILLGALFILQLGAYLYTVLPQLRAVEVPPLESEMVDAEGESDYNVENQSEDIPEIQASEEEIEAAVAEAPVFTRNPSADYYALNADYMGWISINDTKVDYPVVRGQDNEYYLHHNFYKEKDVLGTIFMDYRNIGMGHDDHTILYGHHNAFGHMFADLEKFLSEDFLNENRQFTFSDPYTDRTYEIISVHFAPANAEYIQTNFKGNEFTEFYNRVKEESLFPLASEFEEGDKLLSLITCNYVVDDGRLYIHALEVQP